MGHVLFLVCAFPSSLMASSFSKNKSMHFFSCYTWLHISGYLKVKAQNIQLIITQSTSKLGSQTQFINIERTHPTFITHPTTSSGFYLIPPSHLAVDRRPLHALCILCVRSIHALLKFCARSVHAPYRLCATPCMLHTGFVHSLCTLHTGFVHAQCTLCACFVHAPYRPTFIPEAS